MNLLKSTIEFPNVGGDGIYFELDRVAFSFFGMLDVYWYGIIITSAVVLGILYGIKSAAKVGLTGDTVFEIAFWGVLLGVIGARLYYVIFSSGNMSLVDAATGFRGGGLAIYGGIIGAVVGGYLAARMKGVKFAALADLIGLGFLIGHCVGRWGNFFNQEAFGAPTADGLPWGMTGTGIRMDDAVRAAQFELGNTGLALVHPCFLYESLWCLVGFVALHFYMKKLRSFDGEIFLLYILWYGAGRAWIEGLRTDSLMLGDLKVSQLLAIVSALFALGVFIYAKKTLTEESGYEMYKDTEESMEFVEAQWTRAKLAKEKERAKIALARGERELNDPFAQNIIDDDDYDDEDEEDDE
jgi:phosphatidylglycerol:prolipoprotein diacylglycerol transferase